MDRPDTPMQDPLVEALRPEYPGVTRAVIFFVEKLGRIDDYIRYRNLYGNRGQAPRAVRIEAGQTLQAFAAFLKRHPTYFTFLNGTDRVLLRSLSFDRNVHKVPLHI
jgi:hypothetical protein